MRCRLHSLLGLVLVTAFSAGARGDDSAFTRTEDVVYGRKFGTALTLDVFTPKVDANGAGVVVAVSGGWYSAHEGINPGMVAPFLSRGFTVFTVVHGSNPKYAIPDVLEDMHRSIRFIRHNAGKYKIDANRLGITGGSAGGHLSLMIGMSGKPGDPNAKDPVDRESSRVQAVACFFPPTDFLNWGKPGYTAIQAIENELKDFKAPFDFTRYDPATKRIVLITDTDERVEICKQISPITHVSADDPPTLIIHGDADKLVPIQQAQIMIEKLKQAGVTAELITKPGMGHGWPTMMADMKTIGDWFERYLSLKAVATHPAPQQQSNR